MGAYDQNLNTTNQTSVSNAEKNIAQEQANSSLWNGIFSQGGSGLGQVAGTSAAGTPLI